MDTLSYLISSLIILLTFLHFILKKKYNYWKQKNVPHLEPTLLLGNFGKFLLQQESITENVTKICKKLPKEPYIGAYVGTVPVLIVQDPDLVSIITTKEFASFNSREVTTSMYSEPFGRSVIVAHGDNWKLARGNITPMFSTVKLKNVFPLVDGCAKDFEKHLNTELKDKTFDARKLITSFMMSSIVSVTFGIDMNDPKVRDHFLNMGDLFFEPSRIRGAVLKLRDYWPSLFYALGLRWVPKSLTDFFEILMKDVFEARGYKPSSRNDFVDGLLSLKQNSEVKDKRIDDDYLIIQAIAIFLAGFETSASTLSFALYELAKNKEAQAKLCQEIDEYLERTGGKATFESSSELPYTDACFKETLRMYPLLGVLFRQVTKNFVLPSGVELEKGLTIHIPVSHLHYRPDLYPDPEKFLPERFYGDTKQEIKSSTYLPFGDGPRLCIGKRFANIQFVSGLIAILKDHKLELADNMPSKMEYEPNAITTSFKNPILLKRLRRK